MTLRHTALLPLFLAGCLVLPGCFLNRQRNNVPLDPERLSALVPGHTTAVEAMELLGAPTEVVQLGHGSAYRFDHAESKQAGLSLIVVTFLNTDTRSDRAWLFFDGHGILTHAGATLQAADAQWAMPWVEDEAQ